MAKYFDIGIALILIISLAVGVKRGLLCKVAGIVSVVASLSMAGWVADNFSGQVSQLLRNNVHGRLAEGLSNVSGADADKMLRVLGFHGNDLAAMVEQVTEQAQKTGERIVDAVVTRVAYSEAHAIVYMVAFLVLLVVFSFVIKLVAKIKIPGIDQIDGICGGILGLIEGAMVVFFVVWLMGKFRWLITPEIVADSAFLKFFVENTPLSLITKLASTTL